MATNKLSSPFVDGAKINQQRLVVALMGSVYEKSLNFDVIFSVDGQHFKAHRAILAAQSPVFEKMLLDKAFKEANDEIVKLPEKNADSFQVFLRYLYTFTIELGGLELDTIIEVIHLANEYQVGHLVTGFADALETVVNQESVFQIYECAHVLGLESLHDACTEYLWQNAAQVVKCASICDLSKACLIDLISSDLFCAPEIDILFAVQGWYKKHPKENVKDVLNYVRFPYVTLDGMKMARAAPLYKLLIDNDIDLEVVGDETNQDSSLYPPRRQCARVVTDNMATLAKGAMVEDLNAEGLGYFFEYKPTWNGYLAYRAPIIIKLANIFRINSLAFDVYGGGNHNQPCFYTIETSEDKIRWKLLIDCQDFECNRKQLVLFRPRKFQYIRLTVFPVPGSGHPDFSVERFQCPSSSISAEENALYAKECANGKTMLYQRQSKLMRIFD